LAASHSFPSFGFPLNILAANASRPTVSIEKRALVGNTNQLSVPFRADGTKIRFSVDPASPAINGDVTLDDVLIAGRRVHTH
jgi:hypothetical protein